MYPYINIFGRQLPVYALLALAGGLLASWYICRRVSARGEDDSNAISALLIGAAGAFIGGHLLYGLTNFRMIVNLVNNAQKVDSFRSLLILLGYIFGGMVFYGGLFGALGPAFLYLKKKKLPLGIYSDAAAPAVPLFHAFGRIGCFMAGCCYGIECPFGVVLSHSVSGAGDVRRFPVQLLECLINLILFLLLDAMWRKRVAQGRLLRIYFIMYGTLRFADEFLRGDALRGIWLGLSTSQWISAVLVAVSAVSLAVSGRKGAGTSAAAEGADTPPGGASA